jgi:hypothetical protein
MSFHNALEASAINELDLLEHNNSLIPNDRNHRGNAINDFKNKLFNKDGKFLDWQFKSSLKSKYGHTLFVKQGSIRYENAFILAKDTVLQYNLTSNFPKKNLAIKLKADTKSSSISILLGGFVISINAAEVFGTRQGRINYAISYEDETYTIFPALNGFTQFVDDFTQNAENEYQIIIDNDNENVSVLVNGVVLSNETFSHLKDFRIDNKAVLRISSGPMTEAKISELIISQTDVSGDYENIFSLKLFLINDSLVFYDPTNDSNVSNITFNDISPNKSHLTNLLNTIPYKNKIHFLFSNGYAMFKVNALTNSTVGELIDFSVNIWFYIQHSNNSDLLDQSLLVIGNVRYGNSSISLSIAQTVNLNASGNPQFKVSLKHFPTNMTIDYLFEKNKWYNLIYVKKLYEYSFYVDSVFYRSIYHNACSYCYSNQCPAFNWYGP